VLVTRGAAGMELFRDQQRVFQPAFRVEIVDTVGCGDACVGGWMTSLLQRPAAPDQEHLRFAAACAALAGTRAGPYAASAAEVEAILAGTPSA
jgi:fructokinase